MQRLELRVEGVRGLGIAPLSQDTHLVHEFRRDVGRDRNHAVAALQDEVAAMATLIGTPRVDEERVLAQLQKVLAAEREVKQTQIRLLVRIKNLLTEAQQEQLRKLRTKNQP